MTKKNRLFACSLMVSASAQAFTLTTTQSNQHGWDRNNVELLLNQSNCPSGVEDLIENSMKIWNGVETSNLKLSFGGYTTATLAEATAGTSSEVPAIFCVNNMSAVAPQLDPNSIPGFATGARVDGDGYINYGFIILNTQPGAAANISTMDAEIVKVVLAHEMGHLLGLGHSADTKALMYFDASAKTVLGLAKDDYDGITYLYPRDEIGKDKMLGCAAVGAKSNSFRGEGQILLLLLSMPLFIMSLQKARRRYAKVRLKSLGEGRKIGVTNQ